MITIIVPTLNEVENIEPLVRQIALAFDVDGLVVQQRLALIQMLDELGNAAVVKERSHFLRFFAFVGESDLEAFVQKGEFAKALGLRAAAAPFAFIARSPSRRANLA